MLIEGDFTQVPDTMPPVPVGIYTATVSSVEVKPNNAQDGMNAVFEYEIATEGEAKGRTMRMYCSLKPQPKGAHLIRIRRNFLSARLEVGANGVNTDELIGKNVRIKVGPNNYERNGVVVEGTGVDNVLIPGDEGYDV